MPYHCVYVFHMVFSLIYFDNLCFYFVSKYESKSSVNKLKKPKYLIYWWNKVWKLHIYLTCIFNPAKNRVDTVKTNVGSVNYYNAHLMMNGKITAFDIDSKSWEVKLLTRWRTVVCPEGWSLEQKFKFFVIYKEHDISNVKIKKQYILKSDKLFFFPCSTLNYKN